ncbi:hypothetical protein KBY66_09585 [Synechococcus sp. Tobar12-5m-g]|uniref:hypothetical protein n=1 Tax=unclassified Synechococcus TaxID=2626047 RepID=UPI0020CD494C|nr:MULTISPECIES: hypothetical protein [unclassified Synechococcus]MCP9772878.1 hypothetical protein [Synechococcus sp. Tobar12-5m-g]MCP9873656.1 hypothetical protein [Synechococcus sp. Cruz CV-v-12]
MQADDLSELSDDLRRERQRLGRLVASLQELRPRIRSGGEAVEAAALRLHSFDTGVERSLLLVSRTVNGRTPRQGEGWHRRLRESTQQGLQAFLRIRHLVRNLYADELLPLWQDLDVDLETFEAWAEQVARGADG